MNELLHQQTEFLRHRTRRHFLQTSITGLGAMWLAGHSHGAGSVARDPARPLAPLRPHFAARAKRVIWVHCEGAPSQLELFEHKPLLQKLNGKPCPKEFLEGKRFAFIRGVPQLLGGVHPMHQEKKTGFFVSNQLPHLEQVMEKICFLRAVQSDQFNHAPAEFLLHTGTQNLGGGSIGSWVTYGLGTENENLPGYIVLISGGKFPSAGKAAWSSGFLPSVYQGVQCRSEGDPVLFLSNPEGVSPGLRKSVIDTVAQLNQRTYEQLGDPETVTRIAQYEMAFRMQTSAAEAFDISKEPPQVHQMYGTEPGRESFANNCLLARRLAERGVRYIQLYDAGWDSHGTDQSTALNDGFTHKCKQTDRPLWALLTDLEQRGMLDETLVVWGSEFGRTPMRENRGGQEMAFIGRDHHPYAYTIWLAGGGVKPGFSFGETDDIGYNPATDAVKAHDIHATLLHLMGIDHLKHTFYYQGVHQRLSNVTKKSRVISEILA